MQQVRFEKLTPVSLSGLVMPWKTELNDKSVSEYKLICTGGVEYCFVPDEKWANVLRWYAWKNVKVIGLLRTSDQTIIPQMIYPKGPDGKPEKVVDLKKWNRRIDIHQVAKKLNEWIFVPIAIAAVFS